MKDTWAKRELKKKKWSYRKAAPLLKVTYQYLSDICNGSRQSLRLSRRIDALPHYAVFVRENPKYFPTRRLRRNHNHKNQ